MKDYWQKDIEDGDVSFGVRPAIGYPTSPDHSEKIQLFDLLKVKENIGVSLTGSYMMEPAASVCGFYFAHPESKYFTVGKVGESQIVDYAQRKNIPKRDAEKLLSVNLGYIPQT